ncbi:YadA-like family protein [uncultured Dialister sp.]|uniref:YadA-like family protein n=1 Tax=Dialister succinatiphilus TaxID=487173 RepID=UPI00266F22D3|nr:YadA-like family protein [uncultured Dialister sp.]
MNKIYKVMYSKVKQCAVVVSEIAKSHGHNGESSGVRKHAALTAAVLIALGSLSFTTAFVPMTAEAAVKTRTDGSNFVGVERTDGLFEDSDYANHNGQGAHGDDSITIGLKASGGDGTITIGDRRAEKSLGSVYVGRGPGMPTGKVLPSETDDGYWATSVGYQSDATGYGSIAIGSNATAKNSYDKDSTGHGIQLRVPSGDGSITLNGEPDIQRASVAIGYGASADNGNIAIGSYSDASTDLRTAKTPDGEEIKSYLTDNKADSYVSVGKTGALRRISNVADGAADSDAATIAQLKKAVEETDASKKANIDASNIGENLKKADGKTAADSSDKKNNKDAWGNAIGTGKVEKNNGQLVTGGTVYSALENQKKDLSVHAGWGISVAKDKDGKAISLNRNLGRDAYTKDKAVLKADENKSALVIGGRVNPGDATGGQTAEKDYGALGQDSVTVGGADNTVRENGDAAVVVGGVSNTASAQYSTVIGGSANDALGNQSSVFGGHDNDAHGTYSTASGGSMNRAYGAAASVFGGGVNSALGDSSVAVGGLQSTVNGAFAVGIAGGSTNANHALAAGNGANVTVENGTAIGYQATTDEAGTIAFGHDAGDAYYSSTTWPQKATKQNGKYYDANNKEISKAKYDALKNSDGTWNDYSKTPTVVEKTYDKAAYNRLVKVADGKDDHDVVVMEQLTKATNDLTKDLSVNAGWGINVNDVTTKNDDGTETTTKNVISLNRNLGTNYGNKYGNGKVTFEADGENSLIIGGGAINDSLGESDKDFTFGAHAKDSVLVGGMNNDIDKNSERALIVGGTNNKTLSTNKVQQTGTDAIIVGGTDNKAEGDGAVLIGGNRNEASGLYSMTVGGTVNKNDGWLSSIFGGTRNNILKSDKSDPTGAAIFGGTDNTIEGEGIAATIFGGEKNVADNLLAVVVGGEANHSSGNASTVLGGNYNLANGTVSTAIGGQVNNAIGNGSVVVGGGRNLTSGTYSYASGGLYNNVTGTGASSLGGESSSVNGMFSTGVAGGSTGQDAFFSLAAGYQAVVADGGVEKTYLDENNPNDIKEMEKVEEAIQNGNIHSLPGYYMEDPESSLGNAKFIHYDKFSTALGYQATANEPGTIAFGHDAGDESGYTYEWETLTDEKGNPKQNEIDGTTNDYTKAPKSIKKNEPYTSAYYNRLVKVADGIDDHDVVVMEQLKQYAEKDASNLGNNIEVYKTDKNGNVQLDENKKPVKDEAATTTAQKKSKDDWGKALGADPFTAGTATTATNASTSDQLVTGKTLYNYDAPVAETGKNLNYVSANNTTGQNLSALDAQVADNASKLNDKTHNIKYYSVNDKKSSTQETLPTVKGLLADNSDNKGAKGMGSLASGFSTEADGIASTVAGSYSGVINQNGNSGLDFRGAAALSYGTFNVNQNTADTAATKTYSGVANSIVGQANMTTDSNAAIIYGAGNTVTNSYRPIDPKKAGAILDNVSNPTNLGKAMQDAVKESGGQVMVMGGGNNVESAYMSQVVGVGNTVKGNQVENTKGEWGTNTSDTAIKDYNSEKSSQYNYVDGFNNEVINGKHDYIIGANNKLSGDSYDDDKAHPNKRSNKSNIIIGDNHTLSREQNTVIIGSSDTENTQTKANDAVIIGHNANATSDTGADNAVAIGRAAKATGGNAVTIGVNTSAGENSITIGSESHANSGSNIAIGRSAQVYGYEITNAVALGQKAEAHVADGVAIGSGSIATVAGKSTEGYDPATGQNSTETTSTWKATNAAVSIGTADGKVTRQINGVAAGTNNTDAVNVAQLKSLQSGLTSNLTNTGLKFAANSGNEYTAKLGTTVKIQGTDKTEGHEYTADNLTTEIDKDGNITILMDKNVSAEKIAVNGKDGENGKPGTAGSIGISGQDGKAGVGIDGKDGISIKGQNGKDGVTIKGIDGVDGVDGAEGHIGLNGKDGMTDIFTTAGTPGLNGKDGETMTRIVYKDPKGTEHEAATLDDGLKFKGDDGKEIAKKLNNTLDIIGGAKGDLTEGNIGVNSTDKGQLKVQLAKDLKGITSISNQTTTKVGGKDVTTGAKVTLGDDGSVDVNGGKITHVGSGADASGNYTTTTNAANIGDVQKIVKDAVDSAADTTDKALAGKANVDASNIGANLKGEDGKTPATEAEKTKNENAWGSAIGTGKIEANNGQLVTGKTVYEYNKPVAEDGKTLNYVSEGKTTGQNLGALDAQVKNNADAIKKNSESIQNITNNVKNLSDNAVQYDKDSNKTKVTLGGDGGTTITNVMDGALSDNSTDAVNGKQLYNEQEARKAADNAITEKVTNNTNEITKIENGEGFTDAGTTVIKNLAKDAVQVKAGTAITVADNVDDKGNKTYTISANNNGTVTKDDGNLISGGTLYNEVHVTTDGSYIKGSQTVGQNLSSLDSGLKTTSDLIHTNTAGDTIQIGGNSTATKIDVNGKDGKGRVITGVVVRDANDPTSAANVGYVNGVTAANTQQIYRDMNNAYGRLNNNINKAAAGSNALAALHPLDYDPDDKADFAVGYGHYRNANAAAVGAFYHPNENTMVNVGVSLGNGDPGFNAGVSFKVGRGGAGHEAMSKTEMAKVINSQSKEIDALKKDNADKDKRIDALEQKMAEILAKLDKNGK